MRTARVKERCTCARPTAADHVGLAQTAARRDVVDRLRDIQEILAAELALRILRRVPIGLDAEPPTRDVGIGAEERRDFVVRPDVERAFGLVSACVRSSGGKLSASSAE